jgi:histidine triad (HIT) family protein
MKDCIFCKIANKEIEKDFIYEDEDLVVFPDIRPAAPLHLLIVPKKHLKDFLMIKDERLMIKMMKTIQNLVKEQKIEDKGYRLVVNGGGAQLIDHLHIHLMGKIGQKVKV